MKKLTLSIFSFIFMIAAPLSLWGVDSLVLDECNLLSKNELNSLQVKSETLARKYNCGVYIGIVPNMEDIDRTYPDAFGIEAYAQYFFESYCGGIGDEGNGILLMLSMQERDYDLAAHGSRGHYTFTDYGKAQLEKSFLSDFKYDDWYSGLSNYLQELERFFEAAEEGKPIDVGNRPKAHNLLFSLIVGLIVGVLSALITCISLSSKLTSVHQSSFVLNFLPQDALKLNDGKDTFLRNTVTREIRQTSSSSSSHGGTTVNRSGYSHRSGKF